MRALTGTEMGAPRGGVGSRFTEFRLLPAPPGAGDQGGRLGVRCHLPQGQGRGLSILLVPSVTPKLPSMCSGGAGHFRHGPCSHRPLDGSAPLSNCKSASHLPHSQTHTGLCSDHLLGNLLLTTEGGKKEGGMEASSPSPLPSPRPPSPLGTTTASHCRLGPPMTTGSLSDPQEEEA